MIGVHWLTLFQEVVKYVIGHRDKPLEVVQSGGCVPAVGEKQVLEVEQYNLSL